MVRRGEEAPHVAPAMRHPRVAQCGALARGDDFHQVVDEPPVDVEVVVPRAVDIRVHPADIDDVHVERPLPANGRAREGQLVNTRPLSSVAGCSITRWISGGIESYREHRPAAHLFESCSSDFEP